MKSNYIPDRGDIVWIDIETAEVESNKKLRKIVLVISPKVYNEKTGLGIVCPMKGKAKGYPFEVLIPSGLKVSGIILADQIKSINWKIRRPEYICKLPNEKVTEVLSKTLTLL